MRFWQAGAALAGAVLVLASVLACDAAQSPPAGPRRLPVLETTRSVHLLSAAEAARSQRVHLRAVVTYYDPYIDFRHGALFVHDSSGCVFVVVPARPILPLRPGTLVDIAGVSAPGDYAPIVLATRVRPEGQGQLPARAEAATLSQLLSGSLDGQWVEIEGRVHAVRFNSGDVTLDVATIQGTIAATSVRQNGVDYDGLVDAMVRIRGNEAPVFNRRRQMVGTRIFFPSLETVAIVEPAPRDPFATPALPVAQLLRFAPSEPLPHRVHVRGTVTLQWPGSILCIQQPGGSLCMWTDEVSRAKAGDVVDALGFPTVRGYEPTLEDVTLRLAGRASPVSPKPLTAAQLFTGAYDGQLIRIDAVTVGQDLAAENPTVMLRAGGFLFPATLPKDTPNGGKLPWKDGSTLRVTGICVAHIDSRATNRDYGIIRADSVKLLLRSESDVQVLHAPSWWNAEHALDALALFGLVALAALAWIVVLRHRVEQQTEALRSSEERLRHLSEHDSLTNLPNRILFNDRLKTAVKAAAKSGGRLALLMVDVDGFKEVNDALGHHTGDRLLCEIANRLSDSVRTADTVARIGGDEFIVLLPDLRELADAETIAAKIVCAVSAPIRAGANLVTVTVSVGVCTWPDGGADFEELMRSADAAMYRAKAGGKNRIHVYRPNMAPVPMKDPASRDRLNDPLPFFGS
ncbi:MAG: diguanylate cyclase domain-containing protein [Terracidiphilus sp.]